MVRDGDILRALLLASSITAMLDLALMMRSPWGGSLGVLLTLGASAIVLCGGLVGVFARLWLLRVPRYAGRLPAPVADVAQALPLLLFAWWVPTSWIVDHSRALGGSGWALVATYGVASLLCAVALVRGLRFWRRREPSAVADGVFSVVCFALATGGFWLDAHVLVGLYDDFHAGLFVGSLLVLALGIFIGLPHVPALGRLPHRIDWAFLGGAALTTVVFAFLFSGGGAPRDSLAFAKIYRLSTVFSEDAFEHPIVGPRERSFRVNYDVPRCEDCNVLLLTIDAVRADHLGCYGYHRSTTPHLDALAEKSLKFSHAYTQATKTFDSLPSIYSGLYPSRLDRNYKHPRLKSAKTYLFYVDEKTTFLSERFKKKGYSTAAFYGFHFGNFGYHRGFDHVVEDRKNVTPKILQYIKRTHGPFFLSAHFGFPHAPYEKHRHFDFGNAALDRYDSEIAFADQQIQRILELLRKRGLMERTIVVVSADHGEEFGEHGGEFHSRKLHEELLHVPLIVWHPKLPSQTVEEFVELVDVAPFLVEALGLEAPPEEFDGQSLLASARGQRDPGLSGAYSENYERKGMNAASLVTAEWRATMGPAVGGMQLFDKVADPGEQLNVASRHPEVVESFEELLRTRGR